MKLKYIFIFLIIVVFIFNQSLFIRLPVIHANQKAESVPLNPITVKRDLRKETIIEPTKSNLRGANQPASIPPTKKYLPFMSKVPLNGNRDIGYYYATMFIGTPTQRFTVIVDTGSSIVSVPANGCNCGRHLNPYYNMESSKTASLIPCPNKLDLPRSKCKKSITQFIQSYGEGSSYVGKYVNDIVYLGNTDSNTINNDFSPNGDSENIEKYGIHFPFGIHHKETGLFRSQLADGILGLAPKFYTFVSYLFHEKELPAHIFTLCLYEDGGYITLGGIDKSQHLSSSISYTNYDSNDYYFIDGTMLKIGDNILLNSFHNFMIDSGSSLTYFSNEVVDIIVRGLDNYCRKNQCRGKRLADSRNDKFCYTNPSFETFPDIVMSFGNSVTISVKPFNYMWSPYGKFLSGRICLGIYPLNKNILGNNFMRGHDVIFDLDKRRIGFVEANCNPKLIGKM